VKAPPALADLPRPLYFFDGYCVLCSGFVAFCLAHDPDGRLKFASAQSSLGQRALTALALPDGTLDRTILLIDGDAVYARSTAVLRAVRHLRGPVRWLWPLLLIPAVLRDPLYDVIARHRYRWFGRRPSCFMPTPETRGRFIDL
jgi:predicted DCC family thiol-disulfide oxidoreductase YuxK